MKFRPCIDIHNGKVKQIVGGSLLDQGDQAVENFAADQEADYFANLYKKDGLKGGHVILLNPSTSEYYPETKKQALKALQTYQDGLQIGGGITVENAEEYMKAGASHVIVTSYVFKNGEIYWDNLQNLCDAVGKEHVVLDLSCRKKDEKYYIVTDRWQTFTNVELNTDILEKLSGYCDEFLVQQRYIQDLVLPLSILKFFRWCLCLWINSPFISKPASVKYICSTEKYSCN